VKLALFSDLHANLPAFDACLAHARAQGMDRMAVLGDLVGYGPHPGEVVERCRELQRAGAIILRGNHDSFSRTPVPTGSTWADMTSPWTRNHLDDDQREWLEQLPLTERIDSIFLVHATAEAPEKWHYALDERLASRSLDAATRHPDVRYVFGGHVHEQSLFYRGSGRSLMRFVPKAGVAIPVGPHRYWLATVGSAGQPRDGDTRANYALLDLGAQKLSFHRVAYDHLSVAREMREVGLPEVLATRLENGR
jgi:diadenosine tetraphosphatase ApaH/serine/threonine PP2A family protein phosphatase